MEQQQTAAATGQRLSDLVPHEVEISLSKITRPLKLRACTLADDIWAQKKFGHFIEQVLVNPKLEELVQIFFRLLDLDSQSEFSRRKVRFIDDSGADLSMEIGGADLLVHFISGGPELMKIAKAIMESVGFSRPILEEAEKEAIKKKSLEEKPSEKIGEKSLISSPTSTDGQPTTSSVELSKRSHGESPALEIDIEEDFRMRPSRMVRR